MSKDIIWNTGREFGENIHPELKTFSVVVSSEMTPGNTTKTSNPCGFIASPDSMGFFVLGFHIIVYAAVGTGPTKEIVAGKIITS